MKNLNEYLKINESSKLSTEDVEAVADAIASYLDGDEFPLDAHFGKTGTGWQAARKNSVWDVIEFCTGWTELSRELDVDEDELYDFADEHYDEIIKLLKANYPDAKRIS